MKLAPVIVGIVLLAGCAVNKPDHFYVLNSATGSGLNPRSAFATQVTLRVSLPTLVDRSEMVLVDPKGVRILEHERWGAPLDDQVLSVLGQDIEARREDAIVVSRRMVQPGSASAGISVDIVQLALQQGSGVRLEARWQIEYGHGGKVSQGRETFSASVANKTMFGLTSAVDVCLGSLADRLASDLPRDRPQAAQ